VRRRFRYSAATPRATNHANHSSVDRFVNPTLPPGTAAIDSTPSTTPLVDSQRGSAPVIRPAAATLNTNKPIRPPVRMNARLRMSFTVVTVASDAP
jgi:hypothetical protein